MFVYEVSEEEAEKWDGLYYRNARRINKGSNNVISNWKTLGASLHNDESASTLKQKETFIDIQEV